MLIHNYTHTHTQLYCLVIVTYYSGLHSGEEFIFHWPLHFDSFNLFIVYCIENLYGIVSQPAFRICLLNIFILYFERENVLQLIGYVL